MPWLVPHDFFLQALFLAGSLVNADMPVSEVQVQSKKKKKDKKINVV